MNLVFLIIGIVLGCGATFTTLLLLAKRNDNKIKKKNIKIYEEVLTNLTSNEVSFNSRVNNTVQLNTIIESEGEVQIMYFLDKQDISVFQDGDCLYTSSLIGKEILEKILKTIWSKFSIQINDVVQLHSNTFDRRTFMIITGTHNNNQHNQEIEEIDYNLDDILDKINEVGYNNLTDSEKQFLKNLNK
jgi:hypothetical protein